MIRKLQKCRQAWICPSTHYLSQCWGHICRRRRKVHNDWNRVLDASTLLRTQWRVSDNMTSDISKTCSLTIRFTSYRAHLKDEADWWLFSRTYLFLMKLRKLSTCESTASRFHKQKLRWTILCWRGPRDDDQVFREQKWRIKIDTKRRILLMRVSVPRAMTQRSYHEENFTVTGILDDVVLVTSCADVDIVLTYLTIFVVTSVCQLLRRTLYPGTVVIDDVGISSDSSLSTDATKCIAWLRKKNAVSSGGNRKDLVHIFNVFLSQQFLSVRSYGTALDDASGRPHFFV